jgi:alpha-beta hydrolase superfamily lysophospholipase
MKHEEGRIAGAKQHSIYWQAWLPAKIRAVVLIAHGLGEHGGRYAHVAEALNKIGCGVYAIDHRGHGKSDGARAFVDRFSNVVADMDQLVEMLRKKYQG